MSSAFNFVSHLAGEKNAAICSAGLVAAVVAISAVKAKSSLKREPNPLVPDSRLSLRALYDLLGGFILWLGDSAMGKENRKYLPFAGIVFLYVLSLNLLGLIPGFLMPTDQFQFNLGMALTVFVMFNYWGIREVGLFNYLKHLWGPFKGIFLVLGIILFPIEVISMCVRPLTLGLRLYGNMTGDHLALAVFTDITKVLVPVAFLLLGTIVCFVQAFVFALLTMIYIRLAVAHGEH
ncbi:MAG TPA: F0F1 ATP synthase subunit A [Oligoflexia bacterium]|nr:F0F1 ATP synthase subunit A [Oligoflexia bacterium]